MSLYFNILRHIFPHGHRYKLLDFLSAGSIHAGERKVAMKVKYLTPRELSARWRLSHKTLEKWRHTKRGPPYIRVGKSIRYNLEIIESFERVDTPFVEIFSKKIASS